jgi:hypothetical protein
MIYKGKSIELPLLEQHRYEAVGRCIYCDARADLSDEHIVPFGLGGNLILPRASCPTCSNITSRLERTVLTGPLRSVRVFRGIQSRRKHRGAPTLLPLQAKIDGEWRVVQLPHDN